MRARFNQLLKISLEQVKTSEHNFYEFLKNNLDQVTNSGVRFYQYLIDSYGTTSVTRLSPINKDEAFKDFMEYLDSLNDNEITQEIVHEFRSYIPIVQENAIKNILPTLLGVIHESDKDHYTTLYNGFIDSMKNAKSVEEMDYCRGQFISIIDDQLIAANKSGRYAEVSSAFYSAQKQINDFFIIRSSILETSAELSKNYKFTIAKQAADVVIAHTPIISGLYGYAQMAYDFLKLKFQDKVVVTPEEKAEIEQKAFNKMAEGYKHKMVKTVVFDAAKKIAPFLFGQFKAVYGLYSEIKSIGTKFYNAYKSEQERLSTEKENINECTNLVEREAVFVEATASSIPKAMNRAHAENSASPQKAKQLAKGPKAAKSSACKRAKACVANTSRLGFLKASQPSFCPAEVEAEVAIRNTAAPAA